MRVEIERIKENFTKELIKTKNLEELRLLEIKYLGRKGIVVNIFSKLKSLEKISEKKVFGKLANGLKNFILQQIERKKKKILDLAEKEELKKEEIDITQPGKKTIVGHIHILSKVINEIEDIFSSMGFEVVEGFEAETEHYNFDALNIPKNHPARDLWDTFWVEKKSKENYLLRTHTSPMQVRYMEKNNPPFRIIVPGRVYRYEAIDASHEIQFYQLEGLMVDKKVSLANFKAVIEKFFGEFFNKKVEIRLRPSYFPFTEPSVEVDIKLSISGQKNNWLEVMGAGMVHPKVFISAGYNPNNVSGFAFGVGIDRLAMIKYKIPDIRLFYKGDLRFIKQF